MAQNRLRTIIDAFSQGDEKDFKKIFAALAGPLYYYIYKFIENHEDTEEIITDVFLKVIPELGNFENPKHLKDWLFLTAKNTCLNHIAKQNTKKHTQVVDIKEGMEERNKRVTANLGRSVVGKSFAGRSFVCRPFRDCQRAAGTAANLRNRQFARGHIGQIS